MIKTTLFKLKQAVYFKKIKKQAIIIQSLVKNKNVALKGIDQLSINEVMSSVIFKINDILNINIHLEQIIGALFLINKHAIEMKTGEGKTLVALIAALTYTLMNNKSVTIVTVNDYLANRDAINHKEIAKFFNKTIGFISKENQDVDYKKCEYKKDIIYSSAHELGYDYLRDNLVQKYTDKVQGDMNFVIIDEIDSVLIDEASQPLSIVGSKAPKEIDYDKYIKIKEKLKNEIDYICNYENKSIELQESAYDIIEEKLLVKNIFEDNNSVIELNIISNFIYIDNFVKNGKDYIVENDKIVPIDSYGRKAYGQRFKSDIQQAIEFIENITITNESEIIAETTYQNYFRMYKILTGMSGTLKTEENEFADLYNLDVFDIPIHFKKKRIDDITYLFKTKKDKDNYLINYVKKIRKTTNQPILIGTSNINDNDSIIHLLEINSINAISLSARDSSEESEIIKNAGEMGSIIVATNIAGRGVDIKLSKDSKEKGGLIIIGYSKNITRRLDNQLIGRAGRQGDEGISFFLLSLEDTLIKDFAKGVTGKLITNIMDGEEYIQSEYIEKLITKIQRNIEDIYYDSRINLLKFDNVIKLQRDSIYKLRDNIMTHDNIIEVIDNSLIHIIDNLLKLNGDEYLVFEIEKLLSEYNIRLSLKIDNEKIDRNTLYSIFINLIKEKFKGFDKDTISLILKEIYLTVTDREWSILISKLEELRMGINLRSIGQKDTNMEFQKDSYFMYNKMLNDIKINILNTLLYMELKREEKIEELKIN